jgi:hypothetical protein
MRFLLLYQMLQPYFLHLRSLKRRKDPSHEGLVQNKLYLKASNHDTLNVQSTLLPYAVMSREGHLHV